jgi:hypothetical protein
LTGLSIGWGLFCVSGDGYTVNVDQFFELGGDLVDARHVFNGNLHVRPAGVARVFDVDRANIAAAPGKGLGNTHQYAGLVTHFKHDGVYDV